MDGNLSNPPIVYTQPRIWLVILFAGMAYFDYKMTPLFTKLLFAVIQRPPATVGLLATITLVLVVLLSLVVLIAAITFFCLLRIISPGTLSLSPDGITTKRGARMRHYEWRLVTNVRVDSGGRGSRWVVFDYPQEDTPTDWFWRLNSKLGGASVGLGGWWNASCEEIADTISEARKKWYKGAA
jgi:hypothetical protein